MHTLDLFKSDPLSQVIVGAPLPNFAQTLNQIMDNTPATNNRDYDTYSAALVAIEQEYPDKPIKTDADLASAKALQSYLTGLECTAYNSGFDSAFKERLFNVKTRVQKRLISYTKRQLINDPKLSLLCRYALSDTYFTGCDHAKLMSIIHSAGHLMKATTKNGQVRFYIRGLKAKVGDNTFSIDRRGRDHRQYLNVTVPQAFPVYPSGTTYTLDSHAFIKSVPDFETDKYYLTSFGDGKGLARHFPVKWHEVQELLHEFGCM